MKEEKTDLNKYRAFLFPGIAVVLIILSGMLVLKPKINDLSKLKKDITSQKEELSRLSQKVAVLESYDRNELKRRTDQVLKVLPAEKDAPLIMAALRQLINDHDLELKSLDIGVGEISTESAKQIGIKKAVPALDLELSLVGVLDDLYEFLNALDSITPLIEVDELQVGREGLAVEAGMELSSYYLLGSEDSGKIDRQIVAITPEEEKIYQEISFYKPVPGSMDLPEVSSGRENPFVY